MTSTPDPRHVLVAGGGIAALEAALALRALACERVSIEILAPQQNFVYRPLSVGEPFGRTRTARYQLAAIAQERGFGLTRDALESVDAGAHRVLTQEGASLPYDTLILALGARQRSAVPGALTFRGPQDTPALQHALEGLAPGAKAVFIARSGTLWTLPIYELALMTAGWSLEHGLDLAVSVVTWEKDPLALLGHAASDRVRRVLAERGIELLTEYFASDVEDGRVWMPIVGSVPADLAVALPFLVGPAIPGVPADEQGFVPVDTYCQVRGAPDVYAIGDVADHAVKQGGLATQQADVAARHIAYACGSGVVPVPYEPVLRALLLTGDAPLWMREPGAPELPHAARSGDDALWWPPHKVVGRHLSTYLATHTEALAAAAQDAPVLAATP